jgi:hypothetical protein
MDAPLMRETRRYAGDAPLCASLHGIGGDSGGDVPGRPVSTWVYRL